MSAFRRAAPPAIVMKTTSDGGAAAVPQLGSLSSGGGDLEASGSVTRRFDPGNFKGSSVGDGMGLQKPAIATTSIVMKKGKEQQQGNSDGASGANISSSNNKSVSILKRSSEEGSQYQEANNRNNMSQRGGSRSGTTAVSPPRVDEGSKSVFERLVRKMEQMEIDHKRKRADLREQLMEKQTLLDKATVEFNREYDTVKEENKKLTEQVADLQRKNYLLSSRLAHVSKGRYEEEARALEEMASNVQDSQNMIAALLDSLGPLFRQQKHQQQQQQASATAKGKGNKGGGGADLPGLLQDPDQTINGGASAGLTGPYATLLASTIAGNTSTLLLGSGEASSGGRPRGAVEVELLGACHQLASDAKHTLHYNQTKKLELKNELVGVMEAVRVVIGALERSAAMLQREKNVYEQLGPTWSQQQLETPLGGPRPSVVKFGASPMPNVPGGEGGPSYTPTRGGQRDYSAGTTSEIAVGSSPVPGVDAPLPGEGEEEGEGVVEGIIGEEVTEDGHSIFTPVEGIEGEEGEDPDDDNGDGGVLDPTRPSATGTTVLNAIDDYENTPSLPPRPAVANHGAGNAVSQGEQQEGQQQDSSSPTDPNASAAVYGTGSAYRYGSVSDHLAGSQFAINLVFGTLAKCISTLRDLGESTLESGDLIGEKDTNSVIQSHVEIVRSEIAEVKVEVSDMKLLHDRALSLFTQRLSREMSVFKRREDELLHRLSAAEAEYTALLLSKDLIASSSSLLGRDTVTSGGVAIDGTLPSDGKLPPEVVEHLTAKYLEITNPVRYHHSQANKNHQPTHHQEQQHQHTASTIMNTTQASSRAPTAEYHDMTGSRPNSSASRTKEASSMDRHHQYENPARLESRSRQSRSPSRRSGTLLSPDY